MTRTMAIADRPASGASSQRVIRKASKPGGGRMPSAPTQERALTFLSPIIFLLLWEALGRTGFLDPRFFPAPSAIFEQFWTMITGDSTLVSDILVTLRRVGIGFLAGAIPGMIIGLGMGFIRPLRVLLDPIISMMYPIPKSATMPLLLLIFGFGEASKWVLVAIGVFFPVVLNCMAGVRNINKMYVDVADNFGASKLQYLRFVAFPGALPLTLAGLRLGLGMGLVLVAVAEMIGAQDGLGYMIQHSWELFSVTTMYVGLMLFGLIGIITNLALRELERKAVPWAA